jgi:putative membrane protein
LVPIAYAAVIALAVPPPLIYITSWPAGIIYVIQLSAFILAALVLSIPPVRFRIVPKRRMWDRAHAGAMHQFVAQGIHHTEQHTGVLIFVSLAEQYAEIVADSGINAKIKPQAWATAVSPLISAIKDGRPADGLLTTLNLCSEQPAWDLPPGHEALEKCRTSWWRFDEHGVLPEARD